jgi:hypothetical protein
VSAADTHRVDAERFLRQAQTADAELAGGIAGMATASALLAVEARLGDLTELMRPRSVDLGPFGVVHNPNGLTAEQVAEAFDRAAAFAAAQQKGGH